MAPKKENWQEWWAGRPAEIDAEVAAERAESENQIKEAKKVAKKNLADQQALGSAEKPAGMRVYAKYTGYRDTEGGGVWFGATIQSVNGNAFDLLYDDGDVTGDKPATIDELRFGKDPVPSCYKNSELPPDASTRPPLARLSCMSTCCVVS